MIAACPPVFVLAVVGAECGGKTRLAAALAERLVDGGDAVRVVDEYLREFCDRHGRTPRIDEQAAIAAEQTRRIEAARREVGDEARSTARAGVVVADTTALMTAIYSDTVFGDTALYAAASRDQARCDFTLIAAPDLPWQADGFQRTGERLREAIDSKVRAALRRAGAAFAVVGGSGEARTEAAWAALAQARRRPSSAAPEASRWRLACDCDCAPLPSTARKAPAEAGLPRRRID